MNMDTLEKAWHAVRQRWPTVHPVGGMVCGSGWGDVVNAFPVHDAIPYDEIPGLGTPGVHGHAGQLVWTEFNGMPLLIFQGRRHWYEGLGWEPIALPVYLLKKMSAKHLLLTNAAGGIRPDLKPGDLMAIDDHINQMSAHPLVGPHDTFWGPRFPDHTAVYSGVLRRWLDQAAEKNHLKLHHGIYLAASGPTYETPAEVRAFRTLGADAVGMSTVPEATLAHSAGLQVAGLSCITNLAAGISAAPLSHDEVTLATQAAMARMKSLVISFWEEVHHAQS